MMRPVPFRFFLHVLRLIATLLFIGVAHAAPDKTMSITIDDLPWASLSSAQPFDGVKPHHDALMSQLEQIDAPVIGFVNEGKLWQDGKLDPARLQMLQDWLDAGATLGNHTFDHVDLHAVGLDMYQDHILRGDVETRKLMAARGGTPVWFRHPYLRAGRDAATRDALVSFLDKHGYRIAPVTIDNSEWVFAKAYRDCLNAPDCSKREQRRLRRTYVGYMRDKITYYESQSQLFFDRQIAQILLLHANELNAACLADLVTAIGKLGYRFVALEESMKDPVHTLPVGYNGPYGPSWIHRWAMGQGVDPKAFAGEPRVPQWVLDRAGLTHE